MAINDPWAEFIPLDSPVQTPVKPIRQQDPWAEFIPVEIPRQVQQEQPIPIEQPIPEQKPMQLQPDETTLEFKQRRAIALGKDPLLEKPTASASARDMKILESRPEYIVRKNQPKPAFWAENTLREYQNKYGDVVPWDKMPQFERANAAYEAWLKKNPKGIDKYFDRWRESNSRKEGSDLLEDYKKRVDVKEEDQRYTMSEAMMAVHSNDDPVANNLRYWLHRTPFAGAAMTATELVILRNAVKNIDSGNYTDRDTFIVADAIKAAEDTKNRGTAKKVFDIVSMLPAFGAEFAMTGGAFTAGRKAATKLTEKLVEKGIKSQATRFIASQVIPRAVGVGAQTAVNVPLVARSVAEKWMPEYGLTRDEAGQIAAEITGDDPSFIEALGKGIGSAYIEMGSERAGALLGKAGKAFMKSKTWQKLASLPFTQRAEALQAAILGRFLSNGGTAAQAKEILRRSGWNGMLGEIFEERVGEVARGITGIEKDYGTTGKLLTNDPEGWKQLGIEASAFAVVPTGQAAIGLVDSAMSPKQERLDRLTEVVSKKFISTEDGKKLDIPGETRSQRMANAKEEIQALEKEIQDASQVPQDQTGIEETGQVGRGGKTDSGGDIREQRPYEAGEAGAGQAVEAREEVPVESAREEVQQKTEESLPEIESRGMGIGGGLSTGERVREGSIPEPIKAPNDEVERRLEKAHSLKRTPLIDKLKSIGTTLRGVIRPQEYIPQTPEFASENEFFRLTKTIRESEQDEAIRTVAGITDRLSDDQMKLFERAAVVANQLSAIDSGQPLRFGFENADQVRSYNEQLQSLIENSPEVKQAIEDRKKVTEEIVNESVSLGLLNESALENVEDYYHQQVHLYAELNRKAAYGAKPGKVKRSFQKQRVTGPESLGEEYDYNTNYLESEISWMTDAMIEIRKQKMWNKLMGLKDIRSELESQAANEGRTWQELADEKEGYTIFQLEPGHAFYPSASIPESMASMLQNEVVKSLELTKDELRQVIAIGGLHQQYVIPTELANQLESMKEREVPHGLAMVADEMQRFWKVWTLLNPKRAISYNVRNLTGDIDPVVAAFPEAVKEVNTSIGELRKYHGNNVALSKTLKMARDLGVIGSGFAAEEIPDISDLPVFNRFFEYSARKKGIANLPKRYFDTVKKYTQFREDILRYATFQAALNEYKKNGKFLHYGGSNPGVVDKLAVEMGPEVAAAHIARNLLGDYGNISVAGNWIRRRLMPFWSFQEVNLKRYPRLFRNLYKEGGKGKAAKLLTKNVARAVIMSRIAWMYAAIYAWNNLVMPGGDDDEKNLTPYDRANPHILLGKDSDGSVLVFRNVGALGDFLEWFGLNELPAMMDKYSDGQMDLGEIAQEMAKAPLEKVVGSLRPEISLATEGLMGVSLFPEPLQPRSTRKDEAIPRVFGLTDEYKWGKGIIVGEGNRPRKHYWKRFFGIGVIDPRSASLSEIYDLRNRFLKSKGREDKGIYPVSQYKEARDAAVNEDYDAFIEWRNAFIERHGESSMDKYKAFLRTLDPIGQKLNDEDELEFTEKFLTSEQRGQLKVARDYADRLRSRLIAWWPEIEKDITIRMAENISLRPTRKKGKKESEYNNELRKHQQNLIETKQLFDSLGITEEKALDLLREAYKGKKKTDTYHKKVGAIRTLYSK